MPSSFCVSKEDNQITKTVQIESQKSKDNLFY